MRPIRTLPAAVALALSGVAVLSAGPGSGDMAAVPVDLRSAPVAQGGDGDAGHVPGSAGRDAETAAGARTPGSGAPGGPGDAARSQATASALAGESRGPRPSYPLSGILTPRQVAPRQGSRPAARTGRVPAAPGVTVAEVAPGGGLRIRSVPAASLRAAERLAGRLAEAPGVLAADVDVPVHALGTPETTREPAAPEPAVGDAATAAATAATGEGLRRHQWALDAVDAEGVWAGGTARAQVVAVVDSGVDGTHPDLTGAVLPGATFLADAARTRRDGWVTKDECPIPVDENDGKALDRYGACAHGTHVAGIVAALAGNGTGVAGLGRDARVLPVRVLGVDGSGRSSDVAQGIGWAVDSGATVINLSLGSRGRSTVVTAALRYAAKRGVAVVAAAGNEYEQGNPVTYPAAEKGVLGVAALTPRRQRARFSAVGRFVDVAAPGVDILSTTPGGAYLFMQGTSMAAPYAAAAVALVRAFRPALSGPAAADLVRRSARDLGRPGRDDESGSGLIDVHAARTALKAASPAPAPVRLDPPTGRPVVGGGLVLTGRVLDGGPPARVLRVERSVGQGTWRAVGPVEVDAQGGLRARVAVLARARYRVSWPAEGTSTGGSSPAVRLLVRPDLSVLASTGRSGRVGVRVRTGLGAVAAPVAVQVASSGSWRTVARGRTDSRGQALLTAGARPRGGLRLRVVVTAVTGVCAGATSATVRA